MLSPGYQRMSDALAQAGQSTGRNFVFSLCEWGWVRFKSFSPLFPWHMIDVILVDNDRLKFGCEISHYSYQTRLLTRYLWSQMGSRAWTYVEGKPTINRMERILRVILSQTTGDAGDVSMQWESLTSIINLWETSNIALHTLNIFFIYSNSFLTQATNFYGHNDLDIVRNIFLVPLQASRLVWS